MFYPRELISKGVLWMVAGTMTALLLYLVAAWFIIAPAQWLFFSWPYKLPSLAELGMVIILLIWLFPLVLFTIGVVGALHFGISSAIIGALLGTFISSIEHSERKQGRIYLAAIFLLSVAFLPWLYLWHGQWLTLPAIVIAYPPALIFLVIGLAVTHLLLREARRLRALPL